jgi:hypothetical protein
VAAVDFLQRINERTWLLNPHSEWQCRKFQAAVVFTIHEFSGCLPPPSRATIAKPFAWVHGSFAVLLSHLFMWSSLTSRADLQMGVKNGRASNRDFLSEVGSPLAARILDWTSGAGLSA